MKNPFRNETGELCEAGAFSTGGASDLTGLTAIGQHLLVRDQGYLLPMTYYAFPAHPLAADPH